MRRYRVTLNNGDHQFIEADSVDADNNGSITFWVCNADEGERLVAVVSIGQWLYAKEETTPHGSD